MNKIFIAQVERAFYIAIEDKRSDPKSLRQAAMDYAAEIVEQGGDIKLSYLALECETCKAPAVHAEHFYDRVRAWCAPHTPWSGHYQNCGPDTYSGRIEDMCEVLCVGEISKGEKC